MRATGELAGLRIGITGTPCTGKKSVGAELANLTGKNLIPINDYALSHRSGRFADKEFVVDERRLIGKIPTRGAIVVGHLLPYVVRKNQLDLVFVLRCSPNTLRKRLASRGYSAGKIQENVEAEVLGVIQYAALKRFGIRKIGEFDTTRSKPRTVAKKILDTIIGKRPKKSGAIDWLSDAGSPESLMGVLSIRDMDAQ